MSFFHVPVIYITFHDIRSIPSKNSESVPLFIIEHRTIPHLQKAPSASCQPVAAATPTPGSVLDSICSVYGTAQVSHHHCGDLDTVARSGCHIFCME